MEITSTARYIDTTSQVRYVIDTTNMTRYTNVINITMYVQTMIELEAHCFQLAECHNCNDIVKRS